MKKIRGGVSISGEEEEEEGDGDGGTMVRNVFGVISCWRGGGEGSDIVFFSFQSVVRSSALTVFAVTWIDTSVKYFDIY